MPRKSDVLTIVAWVILLCTGFPAASQEQKLFEYSADNLKNERLLQQYAHTEFPCSVDNVIVRAHEVEIRGNLDKQRDRVCLVEVPLWQNITQLTSFTEKSDTFKSSIVFLQELHGVGSFRIRLPRHVVSTVGNRDRLTSRWALLQEVDGVYTLLSACHAPDQIVPIHELSKVKARSKKGLGGFTARGPIDDLDELEIATVTINVMLNFLHLHPGQGKELFSYNGNNYYFDKQAIEGYDETLRMTASRDILTFGILLIPPPGQFPDKRVGELMVHPDYDSAGTLAMPNVVTRQGYEVYAAALEFLAQRYCRADSKYGRVHHWIAHNECDAGWEWTNAGLQPPHVFLDLYYRSMRTIHNIVRQYDPHAQVFISLTHHWNWTSDRRYYHSRDLLNWLCETSEREGDFEWGVAHHPYPQSLFEPKTWEDSKATFKLNTPLITFKNIEVLAAWSRKERTWFNGTAPRKIYLTEQGPNSRDYSPEQLELQAAAMALVWKKIQALPEISGFHYHNWIDNRNEGGLRIGLRKFPDDPRDPYDAKPIWYLYRDLGTSQEDAACEFAKPVIGIQQWDEVINTEIIE